MVLHNPKRYSFAEAVAQRAEAKACGRTVVLTNGCFDLLHTGHIAFLQQAATLGNELWVALNGDESVRSLKGPLRPILNEEERMYALAAMTCIRGVFVFHSKRLDREIALFQPDHYAKAGDYTLETLNPEERRALEGASTQVHFLPFIQGYSTTSLIGRIAAAAHTF
jgi:rfaE bifunctional protein nucleotidyltransferase chain/domain